jgi:hypothetical protein
MCDRGEESISALPDDCERRRSDTYRACYIRRKLVRIKTDTLLRNISTVETRRPVNGTQIVRDILLTI